MVVKLHSNFKSVPLLLKNINMSIVNLFYEVFIILKIKVALINCSWSKAPSKAAKNNVLIVLITAQLGVVQPDWGQKEVRKNYPRKLSSAMEAWLMACSPLWKSRDQSLRDCCTHHGPNCELIVQCQPPMSFCFYAHFICVNICIS